MREGRTATWEEDEKGTSVESRNRVHRHAASAVGSPGGDSQAGDTSEGKERAREEEQEPRKKRETPEKQEGTVACDSGPPPEQPKRKAAIAGRPVCNGGSKAVGFHARPTGRRENEGRKDGERMAEGKRSVLTRGVKARVYASCFFLGEKRRREGFAQLSFFRSRSAETRERHGIALQGKRNVVFRASAQSFSVSLHLLCDLASFDVSTETRISHSNLNGDCERERDCRKTEKRPLERKREEIDWERGENDRRRGQVGFNGLLASLPQT